MLLGTIHLKQTHIILQDVDGSEVSLTLEDALDLYNFLKDHKQEIEEQLQANWQEHITLIDKLKQELYPQDAQRALPLKRSGSRPSLPVCAPD
jgi:hypothetical protein